MFDIIGEYQQLVAQEHNLQAQLGLLSEMFSTTTSVVEKYQVEVDAKRMEAETKKAEKELKVAELKEKLSQMELELSNSVIEGIKARAVLEPEFGKVVDAEYLKTLPLPVRAKLLTTDVSEIERIRAAQEHDQLCNEELPERMEKIAADVAAAKPSWKVANELRGRICGVKDALDNAGVTKPDAKLRKQLWFLWAEFDKFKERCPAENALQQAFKQAKKGKNKNGI